MAVKFKHSDCYSTYFCTFTCYKWLNLIEEADGYPFVYKWFEYLKENKVAEALGFVIMPNHVHFILYFASEEFNLSKVISNGKRFIAYGIIKQLLEKGKNNRLNELGNSMSERELKKKQRHHVFKDSFDAKPIYSEWFLQQKLRYIHLNPVSKKWHLVDDYCDFEHSSASFYERNTIKQYAPGHYLDPW